MARSKFSHKDNFSLHLNEFTILERSEICTKCNESLGIHDIQIQTSLAHKQNPLFSIFCVVSYAIPIDVRQFATHSPFNWSSDGCFSAVKLFERNQLSCGPQ
ncbi:hypothetical protein L596_015134 [Steinernema carpocapsae]|uniref:Uncharacterized protein n=1 Tax=Steinernema carpocapsae TaxID=34508 RepID=A0A4U5NEZ0_STECR|nr:hypothetical protein L596_015134 [Steinernema carpocapsae]